MLVSRLLTVAALVAAAMGSAEAVQPGPRLYFEKNQGQADVRVAYLARTPTMTALLTQDGPHFVTYASTGEANRVRMTFTNADKSAWFESLDPRPGRMGYFIGSDSSKWIRGVPTFGRVTLHNLYQGVDLVYYDSGGSLAYDLLVQPDADVSQIRMTLEGHRGVRIDSDGNLHVAVPGGVLQQSEPRVFAVARDGEKRRIDGAWANLEDGTIGFRVWGARSSESVIIDPTLSFSTYLGGTHNDWFRDMAVSPTGEAYLVGLTFSTTFPVADPFPTTPGAFQSGNFADVFVVKMNSSGELIYGAIVGGLAGGGVDDPVGVGVDAAGNVIVAGNTNDSDFPTTPGAFDPDSGLSRVFVFKLNASGSALEYSTVFGGDSSVAGAVATDAAGNAYVAGATGSSSTFPTTPGSFGSPNGEIFVTKLNPSGSSLVYSGRYCEICAVQHRDLKVNASGRAYLVGLTFQDIPVTPDALKGTRNFNNQFEGFLTEISADGSSIPYSTFIGGAGHDYVTGLALDSNGSVHMVGVTYSDDFPTTPSALKQDFEPSLSDPTDFFYLRLNGETHALEASTYLGGTAEEGEPDVAVNASGRISLAGSTRSTDFPLTQDALQPSNPGDLSPVLVKLSENAGTLLYSSYLGSDSDEHNIRVAADDGNGIYVAGYTNSVNFPATPGAFQTNSGGSDDTFLVRFEDQDEPIETPGDVNGDGKVDITDIQAITQALNTPATQGDPRDINGDGRITVLDARQCVLLCTNPRCAP
jgi:hypothetical protein